jgi:hypothetical protein
METQNSESISGQAEAYWPRLFPHQPWPLRKPRLPPYWPLGRPLLPLSCRLPWSFEATQMVGEYYCLLSTDWEPSIPRVYNCMHTAQSFLLAQKSNQKTWFSTTLDFSLDFRWFSSPPYAHCTVLSKKTKLSYFGGLFSLVFYIQAIAWFSCSCFHAETRTK